MMTTLWENRKVSALATGAEGRKNKNKNTMKHPELKKTSEEFPAENHIFTSQVKQGNGGGGDPGGRAGLDSKVTLDVQEEDAEVLEDSGGEAHDEEGRHDDHPAVPTVGGRPRSLGLHL